MSLEGRIMRREFFGLEWVVSFVVDVFPWDEIEGFAAAIANISGFPLRLLPARRPGTDSDWFDYEVSRAQAENRTWREMFNWESVALEADRSRRPSWMAARFAFGQCSFGSPRFAHRRHQDACQK